MSPLEQAILRTVTWFDLLSYPLTAFECWQYLYQEGESLGSVDPGQTHTALLNLQRRGVLRSVSGYWQLAEAPNRLEKRLARARASIAKRKRAQAAARLISYLPWVRMVGLVNTTALEAARPESDIDLFIVLEHGRLFLGRLLITVLVQLRGWRRYGTKVRNRLCLSFYVTTEHLNLRPLAYADDPYLTFWVSSLSPLFGRSTYQQFLVANSWVTEHLPNWLGTESPAVISSLRVAKTPRTIRLVQRWLEVLGNTAGSGVLERLARTLELKRIHGHQGSRLGDGTTAVVVSTEVLKFHENDKRPQLAEAWRRALSVLQTRVL